MVDPRVIVLQVNVQLLGVRPIYLSRGVEIKLDKSIECSLFVTVGEHDELFPMSLTQSSLTRGNGGVGGHFPITREHTGRHEVG